VEGSDAQRMLAEPAARKQAPQSAIDAKFSLPFTVATALARGVVDLDSFTAAAREAPEVRAIAEQVQFRQRDDWRGQAVSGAVELHLAGGGVVRQAILVPNGAPSRPLTETALVSKFIDCTARAARPLAEVAARDLAGRLLQLESEPDAGALPWTAPPEDGP
jgi:2-methylcitrate dehydratase PrpD